MSSLEVLPTAEASSVATKTSTIKITPSIHAVKKDMMTLSPEAPPPTVLEGVHARSFPLWQQKQPPRTIPCFPSEDNWKKMQHAATDKGIVFVKPYKTGSSTASGVNLRLARNAANRSYYNNNGHNNFAKNVTTNNNNTLLPQPPHNTVPVEEKICLARSDHTWASNSYSHLNASQSVLWTILRDPSTRAVSEFFHFKVSREKVEPSDVEFSRFLFQHLHPDVYLTQLSLRQYTPGIHDPVVTANRIMDRYDFMGLIERMDESFVVMALTLGVPISDVLYLSAKVHGGYDGGSMSKCTYIWPSFVTHGMQRLLDSTKWKERSHWDRVLHQAVNRSLDLTIDRLGRDRVERTVAAYQAALQKSHDECWPHTRYPCSEGGAFTTETDCLWKDSGCGSQCLDRIGAEMRLDEDQYT